jgi:ER-bound oxygenase mpaB/B'/Rubber oxygenase, catalytic domain
MHAAVRYFIEHDPSVPRTEYLPTPPHGWCAGWGRPLNQEDLLGALLTFTISVFEVLDELGVEVDPDDLEAYLFRWKIIGWLLGIPEDVMPVDVAEGLHLVVDDMAATRAALTERGVEFSDVSFSRAEPHVAQPEAATPCKRPRFATLKFRHRVGRPSSGLR